MVKKFSVLALAGLLALPVVAAAGDVEISGDLRSRMDYVGADSPSYYTALDVAGGTANFLQSKYAFAGEDLDYAAAGASIFGDLGYNGSSLLGTVLTDPNFGAMLAGGEAAFVTAVASYGLNSEQAKGVYAMFTNASVNTILGSMAAGGATVGDFMGYFSSTQNLVTLMKGLPAADRKTIFAAMGASYQPVAATTHDNNTIWTTRMRINLRSKATENVDVKARLAMYKAWGMQSNPVDQQYNGGNGGGPFMLSSMSGMDGATTRQPSDNILRVDRAFANWNNIAGQPIWFSIGRRPTSDGPPAQLRMGLDARMATPVEYMDYPFDGISMGLAYRSLFGMGDFPGRVRFCYGRGFESGPSAGGNGLSDVDFAGLSWDVYKKGDRFFNIQSFVAMDMFNVPDGVTFANPLEYAVWQLDNTQYDPMDPDTNMILDRANLGDIYHTAAVYMDKVQNLNYFLVGGWSHTKPDGYDELGTSLLTSWWGDLEDKDGYSFYAGVRYDLPDSRVKVGLEYNWGSEDWIAFTPGHDDLYASKLAARGSVVEAYMIYNLPSGEAASEDGKAFMRIGYQHYDYDYTGSGFWLGAPVDIDELAADPLNAQFYTAVDTMDQVYLTFEAMF